MDFRHLEYDNLVFREVFNIIRIMKERRMRWAGACSTNGDKRNAYMLLVGKPEGRRPLGRPRRSWLDDIRMNLVEVK
jgi:hypothetical protein